MKYLKNEKGQSLVEFVLILPIVLLLLMGIFEFGFMLNSYLTINHASKVGARLGAIGYTDSEIVNEIIDISPALDASNLQVIISPTQSARDYGETITVTLKYDYQMTIPIISNIFNGVVLEAETSMRVE